MTAGDPAAMPLADACERSLIAGALDRTMLVEAAAGTGKTTELVRRITASLAAGLARVDTLVAVTFTEKAAGELKLRLRSGIERARRAETDPVRRVRLEAALTHLEEARVGTIHGFCADLLRERPVEACLDPAFTTLTEDAARRLFDEAFDRWLGAALAAPGEGLRRSLRRPVDDDTATERLRHAGYDLATWRDFPAAWTRPGWDREARITALSAALHRFAERTAAPQRAGDGLATTTRPARELSARIRAADAVQGTSAGGPGRDDDEIEAQLCSLAGDRDFVALRKKGSSKLFAAGILREELVAEHAELARALAAFARDADADLAALLHDELAGAVARYEELKRRSGSLDFEDLLVRTRDMVRDRPEVRSALQARFERIFVDEFQDTDPLQAEILLLLSADDPLERDWRRVAPAPGKLFVVGDPKQAIYRFRRADLAIYQEVKELLARTGALSVELTVSFRSVPSIQRAVNAAFASRMTGDRAGLRAAYVPLSPVRADAPGQPGVVALPVPAPFNWRGLPTKFQVEQSLPDAVGAFVHWLVAESGWTVTERAGGPERVPVAARHVCLLFKQLNAWRTDLARPYVGALEARGVPHVLVGGKSFHDREEVATLSAALSAIEWPDDELSVFATLRGSLFSIPDEVLLAYRHQHGRFDPLRPPPAPAAGPLADVTTALALLKGLHRKRNERPVADTVTLLLEATRAHVGFALRPSGDQALANVLHVADLGRRYDAARGISFRGFVERLRNEAEGGAPEAAILEEGSDGVRLMTAHKAKGLEFPVVVLADLCTNVTRVRASRYVDPARGLAAMRIGGWTPVNLHEHEAEELERDRAEAERLAYVAATRARDLLVVPVVGDAPAFPAQSWLAPLHAALYPEPERRRLAGPARGCPRFGTESVLVRPAGETEGPQTVCPGLHRLGAGDGAYDVVWWDPARLELGRAPRFGVRQRELLGKEASPEVIAEGRARHDGWRERLDATRARAAVATLVVRTATEHAAVAGRGRGAVASEAGLVDVALADVALADVALADVALVDVARVEGRPGGARFGALVHAVLATVPLGPPVAGASTALGDATAETAVLQGRILGATPAEVSAAVKAVENALAHPLLLEARAAAARGECRRETPVALRLGPSELVEGVVNLAFRAGGAWTVVDFKTDRSIDRNLVVYRQQVALYAAAIAAATGEPARAVLLRV